MITSTSSSSIPSAEKKNVVSLPADARGKPTRENDLRFNIEQVFPIDTSHLIIRGWLRCGYPNVKGEFRLRVDSNDHSIYPVNVIYYPRPDVKAALDAVDLKIDANEARQLGFLICILLPEDLADESPDLRLEWRGEDSKKFDLFKWNLSKHSPLSQLKGLWSAERAPLAKAFSALGRLPHYLVRDQTEAFNPKAHGFQFAPDWAFPAGNCGILYIGWMVDANKSVIGIFAGNPGGGTSALPKLPLLYYPRADLEPLCAQVGIDFQSAGVTFLHPVDAEHLAPGDVDIFALMDTGQVVKLPIPMNWVSHGKPLDRIRKMLDLLYYDSADVRKVFDHYLAPAIQGIYREETLSAARHSPTMSVKQFGVHPTSPETSVIVPLYGRYDFAMYQLAQFANDPDFVSGQVELIYVCDDPRIEKALAVAAAEWFPVYRVPFQIVSYSENVGYAGANNIGVSKATGNHLILLNSDVLPREPGWVGRMGRILATSKPHTIVGATLLFHDETVQHAGMEYLRDDGIWGGMWRCHHPRKGLPFRNKDNLAPQPVAAVTGACLGVSRQTYRALGGLSEDYILGDFEDSDFCMKARQAGGQIYLLPDVVLYHVERQSQCLVTTGHWKEKITIYNAWLHNQRWASAIEAMNGPREAEE